MKLTSSTPSQAQQAPPSNAHYSFCTILNYLLTTISRICKAILCCNCFSNTSSKKITQATVKTTSTPLPNAIPFKVSDANQHIHIIKNLIAPHVKGDPLLDAQYFANFIANIANIANDHPVRYSLVKNQQNRFALAIETTSSYRGTDRVETYDQPIKRSNNNNTIFYFKIK